MGLHQSLFHFPFNITLYANSTDNDNSIPMYSFKFQLLHTPHVISNDNFTPTYVIFTFNECNVIHVIFTFNECNVIRQKRCNVGA